MTLLWAELGNSGKEELPFDRKKLPAETGSGKDSHLPWLVESERKENKEKKSLEREVKKQTLGWRTQNSMTCTGDF